MERIRVLRIDEIDFSKQISFKKNDDKNHNLKIRGWVNKFGQYKIPSICTVEGVYMVVDGLNYIKEMKDHGINEFVFWFVGETTVRNFIALRMFENIKKTKIDHIKIAETISKIVNTKIDASSLSNQTNLSIDDIEKYSTLLDFDWDEFARTPIPGDDGSYGDLFSDIF